MSGAPGAIDFMRSRAASSTPSAVRRRNQLFEIEDGYWPQPGGGDEVSGSPDLHVRRRRIVIEQFAAEHDDERGGSDEQQTTRV